MELKKKGISTSEIVGLSIGLKAKGVSANANYGKETSSSTETTASNTLKAMNIQTREFYIGGEPPTQTSSQDDQASTQSLREWSRSAFERPVPIQYELKKIEDLFSKINLPSISNTDQEIAAKKKCMKKALKSYCSKVAVDKEDCVAYEDGMGKPNVIRFGDFISIKEGGSAKYLNVPDKNPKFGRGNTAQSMKVHTTKYYWKKAQALQILLIHCSIGKI